jgi:hypothetical protein
VPQAIAVKIPKDGVERFKGYGVRKEGGEAMAYYLGIDSSTQSMKAL